VADSIAAPQKHRESSPVGNQPGQGKARLAPFQVLKGIIVQPRATFVRLRSAERGHWWLVLLLSAIAISLLSFATVSVQNTRLQGFTLPSGESTPQTAPTPQAAATPRQARSTPQAGSVYGRTATPVADAGQSSTVLGYVLPIVAGVGGVVLGYLFCSFVVFGMSIVFGGKATYTQVFRMAAWASLPLAIGNLVQSIASLVTGGTPAPGLSAVLTSQEALDMPALQALLGHLDVYLIWSMVLLGVGTVVTSKLSKRKSATVVIIYLVLAAGVIVGLTAASGALGELFGGQFNLSILTRGTRLR
jgi:hypothetical protein